jgi:hypothetical protein
MIWYDVGTIRGGSRSCSAAEVDQPTDKWWCTAEYRLYTGGHIKVSCNSWQKAIRPRDFGCVSPRTHMLTQTHDLHTLILVTQTTGHRLLCGERGQFALLSHIHLAGPKWAKPWQCAPWASLWSYHRSESPAGASHCVCVCVRACVRVRACVFSPQ